MVVWADTELSVVDTFWTHRIMGYARLSWCRVSATERSPAAMMPGDTSGRAASVRFTRWTNAPDAVTHCHGMIRYSGTHPFAPGFPARNGDTTSATVALVTIASMPVGDQMMNLTGLST